MRFVALAIFLAVLDACAPCSSAPTGFVLVVQGAPAADTIRVRLTSGTDRFEQTFPLGSALVDGETSLGVTVTPTPTTGSSIVVEVDALASGEVLAAGETSFRAAEGACDQAVVRLVETPPVPTCQELGTCPEEVFVRRDASCPGEGTLAAPYCLIGSAVASGAATIHVAAGEYPESVSISSGAIALLGEGGVTISAPSDLAALSVSGGAVVSLRGASLVSNGDIVVVSGSARLLLADCSIGPTGAHGIVAQEGAALSISRCRISRARRGGIEIDSTGGFTIESSIVSQNGGAPGNSGFGGILVRGGEASVIHSTIFANAHNRGAGGVVCSASATIVNSIVWGNTGNDTGFEGCSVSSSDLGAPTGDASNFSEDPGLSADGHINGSSPCVDRGAPGGAATDIDGDARPRGAGPDVGADEAA
ncbi:MAG: right-handed parallel beta-helix repeat-containing protein [Deltaproteobacteria bacterium]|nr:right-handed parallel beta-helix repeat-containing protein [Deltaproteobacteria bacterium]